jgi:hypothetical protein
MSLAISGCLVGFTSNGKTNEIYNTNTVVADKAESTTITEFETKTEVNKKAEEYKELYAPEIVAKQRKADYYKELYAPKPDYTKIVVEGYTFDIISGAPYSVYTDMAKAKKLEEQKLEEQKLAEQTEYVEYTECTDYTDYSDYSETYYDETPEYTSTGEGSLNAYDGVCYYGNQKETYYNLPMGQVIENAHNNGIDGEYWVREDGCKMLGNYIMVAANWSIRPKGTILETSLGTAIVVDTGSFVSDYPEGIDIAVDW